jgi:hypothetical protein
MKPEVIQQILGGEIIQWPEDENEQLLVTGTEARVCAMIARRQKLGINKYGTTVENNQLPLVEWLNHQLEELLDAAIYCARAIDEIKSKADDGK